MNFMKKLAVCTLACVPFLCLENVVNAATPTDIDAKSVIVVEEKSGKVLFEDNPDKVSGIASMSKMITQYLILEAVEEGEITWDTLIPVSPRVMKLSADYELSNVPLRALEKYSLKDLYEAISIYSANAAVVAVAEFLSGSEEAWVTRMQSKIEEFGITDAKLVNASGLPYKYNEKQDGSISPDMENSMSARSVAILARRLVLDYPEILDTASIPGKIFRPGTIDETKMTNFNSLIPSLLFGREGVNGLKTGTSEASGASVTTTATQNGMSVISVVVGSSNPLKRFKETDRILDYVFLTYESILLLKKGDTVQGIPAQMVSNGTDEQISINAGKDFFAAVPKGTAASQIEMEFIPDSSKVNEKGQLMAPIQKDEVIGKIRLHIPGTDLGYLSAASNEIDAVAAFDIEEANFFIKTYRFVRDFLGDLWQTVIQFFQNIWEKITSVLHPNPSQA